MVSESAPPKVTGAQFVAHLGRKAPDHKCPLCRQSKFALMIEAYAEKFEDQTMFPVQISGLQLGSGFPGFGMICNTCGYMMTFFGPNVLAEIEEHESQNGA